MLSKNWCTPLTVFLALLPSLPTQAQPASAIPPAELAAMCELGSQLIPNNPGVQRACRCQSRIGADCGLQVAPAAPYVPDYRHYGIRLPYKKLSDDVKTVLTASRRLAIVSNPKVNICISIEYAEGRARRTDAENYNNFAKIFLNNNGGIPNNLSFGKVYSRNQLAGENVTIEDNGVIFSKIAECH